jgi:hypothetical protein
VMFSPEYVLAYRVSFVSLCFFPPPLSFRPEASGQHSHTVRKNPLNMCTNKGNFSNDNDGVL